VHARLLDHNDLGLSIGQLETEMLIKVRVAVGRRKTRMCERVLRLGEHWQLLLLNYLVARIDNTALYESARTGNYLVTSARLALRLQEFEANALAKSRRGFETRRSCGLIAVFCIS
jgi:hypothetical protein